MRPRLAELLLAVLAGAAPLSAARAEAPAAAPFEVIPRQVKAPSSNRLAWFAAFTGVGLIAGSFPLAGEADRRYVLYLTETDVAQIDSRYDATTRMDRLASGTLLTGEALLATAVWLRFVHRPRETNRLSFEFEPARCAVSLRF